MPKKLFRLKAGKQHEGLAPGQTVELDETQAWAFRDKFEDASAPKTPAPVDPNAKEITPTSKVPQDIGSADPARKDPNPGNKVPTR